MARNFIIGIAGMRGHGKSTVLREKLAGMDANPILVIDTLGDHGDWTRRLQGSVGENVAEIIRGDFGISSVLIPVEEEQQQIAFDYYCRGAYACAVQKKREVTLVVEEADWYSNPNWENEGLKLIVQYGRHGPVNLIWTARNAGSVSRKLTSETDLYILFSVQEPAWLDALSERLGVSVSEEVQKLEPFEYVTVDNRGKILDRGTTKKGEQSAERPDEAVDEKGEGTA